MVTPVITPEVAKAAAISNISLEEEILVSSSVTTQPVETVPVYTPVQNPVFAEVSHPAVAHIEQNEYKSFEEVKNNIKKYNIIAPEDPADSDNICIACQ